MSFNPSNPFVLPGLGQTGDAASNPLFASIEMMRQAFAGLAGQTSAGGGLPLGASLDPAELEKRINELKTVENWLKLNLSMLSSTIQGMEVQLATIHTLKSFVSSAMGTSEATGGPARSPLEVVLGLRPFAPAPAPQAAPARQPKPPPPSTPGPPGRHGRHRGRRDPARHLPQAGGPGLRGDARVCVSEKGGWAVGREAGGAGGGAGRAGASNIQPPNPALHPTSLQS